MSNNIIAFPKQKRNSPPQTMEELIESVEFVRKSHIDSLMDEIMSFYVYRAHEEGFIISNETCEKPNALAFDSLKASLYRSCNFDHSLHELADSIYGDKEKEDEEQDGS